MTFGTNLVRFFIGIATSIILARVLGPEGRGIYALALLLPSLVVTLGNLGIASGTTFFVARREFPLSDVVFGNLILWFIISGVGILVEVLVIFYGRDVVVPGVQPSLLITTIPLIPLELFLMFFSAILLGRKKFELYNLIQFLQTLLFLVLVALMLIALNAGVRGAIISVELSWFMAGTFLILALLRIVRDDGEDSSVRSYIRKTLSFGARSHLSNILGFLNYRIDQFLLNFFSGATSLGFYSVAVGLGEKLWMLSQSVGTVLFPTIAGEEEKRNITPVVARFVFFLTGFSALLLGLLAMPVIRLLYSDLYIESVPMLQALLPGIAILSASKIFANDIAGRGFPMINTYRGILTVLTNVILNIIWIPRWGGVGAALASTVSYTLSFITAVWFYRRLSGVPLGRILLPGRDDAVLLKFFMDRLLRGIKLLR